MKCSIMPYFIWVFTACKNTHLGVSWIQRVKVYTKIIETLRWISSMFVMMVDMGLKISLRAILTPWHALYVRFLEFSYLGLNTRIHVFRISDLVMLKQACSAT